MSRNEDTTVNEKNIGGIGRKAGPRADSDLSGGVTRVEGEKGLETADRTGTSERARPRSWFRDKLDRAVGDPVRGFDLGVEYPRSAGVVALDNHSRPVERIKDCKIDPPVGLVHGDTLVLNLNGIMGTPPDVIECLGQRYVREERVEEARREYRGAAIKPDVVEYAATNSTKRDTPQTLLNDLSTAIVYLSLGKPNIEAGIALAKRCERMIKGLASDVRAAEKAADDWKRLLDDAKDGWDKALAELKEERAKVAELSKVRVFNVAGLVEKDLAERYESLRESFDKLADQRARLRTELRRARALIAESAPVVRYVERLASLSDEDADALDARDIRSMARDNFANREAWASALNPRTYTETQRRYAADVLVLGPRSGQTKLETVDAVAEALGMRKGK